MKVKLRASIVVSLICVGQAAQGIDFACGGLLPRADENERGSNHEYCKKIPVQHVLHSGIDVTPSSTDAENCPGMLRPEPFNRLPYDHNINTAENCEGR